MRLSRFVLVLSIFAYLAWQVSESSGIVLDPLSFIIGVVVAGLAGATLFLVGDWWSSVTRPYQPQTVKLETKQTPSQVTFAAFRALLKGIIVIILVIIAIYGYTYLVPRQ